MPQLEIHHEDGNVTYAELSSAKPLLIGSAQNCDVVLTGPNVKRVHCRIVSRDDRWRVEVAADAGTVQLGDKQVKAGTLRSGDVLGIAGCRIYMDESAAAAAPAREPDHFASDLLSHPAATDESTAAPVLGRGKIRKASHMKDTRGAGAKFWDIIRRKSKEQFQGEIDRPPGQERILGSPLVRWMLLFVLVLAVAGTIFFLDYRNRTILGHFDNAQKLMLAQNWDTAIRQFESFEQEYPSHGLVSSARVQRAMCEVGSAAQGSPSAGIGAVRKLLREQSKEPAFQGLVPKIGEIVAQLAQGMAEGARDKSDVKLLEGCEDAQEMLKRDLSAATISDAAQTKLAETVAQAREAIQKLDELVATREKIDQAIKAGSLWPAYAARERLVQLYNDYAENADIVDRMKQANKLDLDRVQWVGGTKNAETEPRPSEIKATTALADRREQGAAPAGAGNVVFSLVDGRISAHDVATGKPVWARVVGVDAYWLPVPVPGTSGDEAIVLVTDVRHDELLAIRARSGQLVWRQPLGELIEAPPLVHKNKIYQTTGKGSLFLIDPKTGRVDGRLNFGEQRLRTTPVADASGNHLFLLGEQYVLYVITLGAPPKCERVEYLAHRPDSIFAAPLRLERYLVLFENDSASACRMRVFLIEADGVTISEIQNFKINGWVHHAPSVLGNLMFVATDLETVEVWSGGAAEKADGFKKETTAGQATTLAGTRPQAYSIAYTEKDLLVTGSKMRRYEYKKEQQVLTPSEEKLEGAAVQPIQRYPAVGNAQLLFVARRIPDSTAVIFTALDAATLEWRWEVQLGTGLLSLLPGDAAGSAFVALTRGGQAFSIPAASLAAGGVLDQPSARIDSSAAIELSDRFPPVLLPDGSSVYAPRGSSKSLFVRGPGPAAAIRQIELPAAPQGNVAAYENGVLVPAADGRIYLIDPATKKQLAEPFQPSLSSDQPIEWRGVGLTAQKTIVAGDNRGNIFQIELKEEPLAHLSIKGEVNLQKKIRSELAISGNVVCCVDDESTLHVLDGETMTSIGQVKLSGPASLGPVAAGGYVFIVVGDDEFLCVNAVGQVAWRHALKGETVVGRPIVKSDAVHFVTANGLVRALRLADGGELWTRDSEIPLAGGPVAAGDMLVVVGADGSLNVVKAPTTGN